MNTITVEELRHLLAHDEKILIVTDFCKANPYKTAIPVNNKKLLVQISNYDKDAKIFAYKNGKHWYLGKP